MTSFESRKFPTVKKKNVTFEKANKINKNFEFFKAATFIINVKINQVKRKNPVTFLIFPTSIHFGAII